MRQTRRWKYSFIVSFIVLVLLSAGPLWAAVPNTPSGLTATALSATQIRIDWTDNSTDETSFYIERKTGAGGIYASMGTVGANITTYTSANMFQNTEYYYRVRAYNASGYSAFSNEAAATTLTLNAPANLSVSAVSYAQATLTWTDNSSDETGFSIERMTGAGGTYTAAGSVGANVTTFTVNGLTQGTEYYYRVRAVSGSNYSQYSGEANATTLTLNAPSNLTATPVSPVEIRLDWTDNSTDETNVYVERKTGAGGIYAYIGKVGANVTTYVSTDLMQDTAYYYRIRAYNAGNYSSYSGEAGATTLPISPPSNLSVTAISSSQIRLTWTDNSSDEMGFSIERKTGAGGTYAPITTITANSTSYTNTGLIHGTEYYYRVRAYIGTTHSQYSNEVSITPILPAPSELTANPLTAWHIELKWNDNAVDETSYYVEYKVEGTDSYTTLTSLSANTTKYTHTDLTPATMYHYRVRAYNSNGYSTYSSEVSARTPAAMQGTSDSAGTDFFMAFQPNAGVGNLSLFITGKQDTQGVVEIPGLNTSQTFTVQANRVTTVNLPTEAQALGSNTIKNLGVRVRAQNEITVYGLNQIMFTTDAFLALPADILGLEYLAMSYKTYSTYQTQVAVVGVYDNTQVTITPSAEAVGRPAGVPFTITLNRGYTFQLTGSGLVDLTGSSIVASAPVAVMSGVECAEVPAGTPACDHIIEMMPPVTTWGKSFLTVPLATRINGDVFRILASQDNTTVTINGVLVATLERGKFFEKVLTARSQIETSAPVLVAQYSVGQTFDKVVSDPFMMLIPPTEQFLNQYTFSTPADGFTANFVNIVVPTTALSSLSLDGAPISTALFSSIGASDFSGAQVPISLGAHTVTGDVPFGIYVYGFGSYDSYGYPGGMSFQFINPAGDPYPPNVRLISFGDTIQGQATDSEDVNANGVLDAGEDLNGNGIIDRRSEDVNGNGVLDPGEDTNGNGLLDKDTGIFKIELDPGSVNLQLNVTPFIPGALAANFSITLIDPVSIGTGTLRVSDGAGNTVQSPILLSHFALLKNVRVVNTVMTNGNEIDPVSFTKQPYSMTTTGDRTVIEWRYDYFPVNLDEIIAFDVIMKNPVAGEQRLINQSLELLYTDVNGKPVRTALDPQYVSAFASVFAASLLNDKLEYQANETMTATTSVTNMSGYARTIDAKLMVEDSLGNPVQQLALLQGISFTPGEVRSLGSFTFSTGSNFAGDYRTRLVLTENQTQTAEAIKSFKIKPTIAAGAGITTDKISYNPNENAAFTSTIISQSPNYVFENLTARITVAGSGGQGSGAGVVYTETKTITTLMPGASFNFKSYWNTGVYPPGTYPVNLVISDPTGSVIASASRALVISNAVKLTSALQGRISVGKQSLLSGETATVSYDVTNIGNVGLQDVTLSVKTVHVVNQTVYDTLTSQATLSMGGSYSNTGIINTGAYTAKDYLVVLRASVGGTEETLAGTYFRVEGSPSTPSLASPLDGSDVPTLTPTLSINNASDPNDDKLTYEFEVYSDSGLANLVASIYILPEGLGTTPWTVPSNLQENAKYYWRARVYDGRLYGDWMVAASFRVNVENDPPTAPIAASPADGTLVSMLTPSLSVTNATDPDSTGLTYNFQLALDPEFITIVTATTGVFEGSGTTSWQLPVSLSENTWYYWRAQADDWLITGPSSSTSRFFVSATNEAPSVPVVVSPANGSAISSLNPDIVLSNSTDLDSPVISYFIELDTVPTFDSINVIRSGSTAQGQGTTTWQASGLQDNTGYYLRAKASDGSADSAWSQATAFFVNTTNDPPTAPTLDNPSSGAGVNVFTPTLSVHNATDIDRNTLTYEFEVYADEALSSRVSTSSGIAEMTGITSWTVPVSLVENQVYWWRARAFDGQANGPWMQKASFMVNTANDAPNAPTLYSPQNGSTLATFTPTLSVTNARDPDSDNLTYDFEVYAGTTLVWSITNVAQDVSGITSAVVSIPLTDNTVYDWRARASDGDRTGPWMANASFTVHVAQAGITVEIEVEPETLNHHSRGNWVMVEIELPHGYRTSDVDLSSIRLEGVVPAVLWPHDQHKHHHEHGCDHDHAEHDHGEIKVKFNRDDVISVLPVGNHVPVHVTGRIGATTFEGVDFIRVIH